jgi:membrane-bound metal-dependent hydrolase YbcI (DUF457 family)
MDMPEPLIHLIIPMAALVILGFKRKEAILLSPLAIFHDFDIFLGAHRSIFHSLIILGIISSILLIYTFKFKKKWKSLAIIISVYLLSHPLLDLITGPIQLFWPFDTYYYLWIQAPSYDAVNNVINFSDFFVKFLILTPQGAGDIGETQPIGLFSNSGLISFTIIGLAIIIWIIKDKYFKTSENIK